MYKRRLLWCFGIVGAYFVELVGGLLTNSLALLSDAGHMLTDVIGLGMAAAAIHAAGRKQKDPGRTFGVAIDHLTVQVEAPPAECPRHEHEEAEPR